MDGNGRWAKQRGLPRLEGHRRGAARVRDIVNACGDLGISYLTLYAFSSENWRRPADEVDGLMRLLDHFLSNELDTLVSKRIRLRVIGDVSRLPANIRARLDDAFARTRGFTERCLTLALSYGSRDEALRAVRGLMADAAAGRLDPAKLDWEAFASRLDTAGMPDPDLVIRTSGELRVSNFLLLQAAYAEFFFSRKLWPEFDRAEFEAALDDFARRERRFGATEAAPAP